MGFILSKGYKTKKMRNIFTYLQHSILALVFLSFALINCGSSSSEKIEVKNNPSEITNIASKKQLDSSLESKKKTRPMVALDPELLWFATLLYCGLDPNQPLVRATMKMIDAEWDKIEEQNKQKS